MESKSFPKFWRALNKISDKFNNLWQNPKEYITGTVHSVQNSGISVSEKMDGLRVTNTMELDLLDKKIRRLVFKLKKYSIDLEVFHHTDIQYGSLLGQGGEAIVHKCTVTYNGVPVQAAAKTVMDNSDDAISITFDELELLCLASDPIIGTTQMVYGVAAIPEEEDEERGHLVIITEVGLMDALQLYQAEEVPQHVTYSLWGNIAGAIHTIHSKKIIHQDLKPENILVTAINRDMNGKIEQVTSRIIDLGMAKRVINDKIVTEDIFGTTGYHAPEVLFQDTYDFRADIFMLGVTFCVLLLPRSLLQSTSELRQVLKQLHSAKQQKQLGLQMFEEVLEPLIQQNFQLSPEIKNMVCCMLEDQDKRQITLLEVMELCHAQSEVICGEQEQEVTFQITPVLKKRGAGDSGIDSGDLHGGVSSGPRKTRQVCSRLQTQAPPTTQRSKQSYDQVVPRQTRRQAASATLSSRSITSITSDITSSSPYGGRRVTRSQSISSMRSDITTMSDITDDRLTPRSKAKRVRCRDSESNGEVFSPVKRTRRTVRR